MKCTIIGFAMAIVISPLAARAAPPSSVNPASSLEKAWSERQDLSYWPVTASTASKILVPGLETSARIARLRETCNTITDSRVPLAGDLTLKRKAKLIPAVQRLCTETELAIQTGVNPDHEILRRETFALELIEKSLHQKAVAERGFGLTDIAKVGFYDIVTPYLLTYEIEAGKSVEPSLPSAWWQKPSAPAEEFDRQLRAKGIVQAPRLVVLREIEGNGSAPKAEVEDAATQVKWLLKWGDEVHSDVVASRILAALGYNVDHPIYFGRDELTLILDEKGEKKKKPATTEALVRTVEKKYGIDLKPFIHESGTVDDAFIAKIPEAAPLKGRKFARFNGASMEPRVSSEVRLGGWSGSTPEIASRPETRALLLALLWIGVWDVKEENTLLSLSVDAKGIQFRPRAAIADMGMSLGVAIHRFPRDVKAGLVNELPWQLVRRENNKIKFTGRMNAWPEYLRQARYPELKWMAARIAELDEVSLKTILSHSGWPAPIQELYFQKLASRRRQILSAFEVNDASPVNAELDPKLTVAGGDGRNWIEDGRLVAEPDLSRYPQGLLHDKGRFRRFGW